MKRYLWLCGIIAALFVIPAVTSAGIITADFEGGETTPDGYPGVGGDGWDAGWADYHGSSTNTYHLVRVPEDATYTKLVDGNYLRYRHTSGSTSARSGAVSRSYADAIDLAAPHAVEFTVRIEEDLLGGLFTTGSDRYQFHDAALDENSGNFAFNTKTGTWGIAAYGERMDGDTDLSRHWLVYDFADPTLGKHFVDSGIVATQGVAYTFRVDIDPQPHVYGVTISGSDGSSFSVSGLDMGDVEGTATDTALGYLNFSTTLIKSTSVSDAREMAIDGIRITQVPEPSTLATMLSLVILGLLRRRR